MTQVSDAKQRRCASKPAYVDDRGFALATVYKVPSSMLAKYPPTVYTLEMARDDLRACASGRPPPHADRVIRYDLVARRGGEGDARVFALKKYHGYSDLDFRDGKLLQLLPYTEKDAQVNIATFAKKGRPYYTVVRATSQVLDPKRGQVRNWRHKGYDDKYRYDQYDPAGRGQSIKQLGGKVLGKFDPSKYPQVKSGGQWVRMVPCFEMPAMCRPGQTTFPYTGGEEQSPGASAYGKSKESKSKLREALMGHSRAMDMVDRSMKGLSPNSAQYRNLAARKQQMRLQFKRFKSGQGPMYALPPPSQGPPPLSKWRTPPTPGRGNRVKTRGDQQAFRPQDGMFSASAPSQQSHPPVRWFDSAKPRFRKVPTRMKGPMALPSNYSSSAAASSTATAASSVAASAAAALNSDDPEVRWRQQQAVLAALPPNRQSPTLNWRKELQLR